MNNFDLRKYLAENKLLKEDKQPTHRIKTDVYYVNNYEFDGFKEEAVPEYEINDVEDMLESDEGNHLYIDAGTEGWFDGEMFETIEGSDTRVEPEYVEDILNEDFDYGTDIPKADHDFGDRETSPELTKDEMIYLNAEIENFLNNSLFNSDIVTNDRGDFDPTREERAIKHIIDILQDRVDY